MRIIIVLLLLFLQSIFFSLKGQSDSTKSKEKEPLRFSAFVGIGPGGGNTAWGFSLGSALHLKFHSWAIELNSTASKNKGPANNYSDNVELFAIHSSILADKIFTSKKVSFLPGIGVGHFYLSTAFVNEFHPGACPGGCPTIVRDTISRFGPSVGAGIRFKNPKWLLTIKANATTDFKYSAYSLLFGFSFGKP